MLSADEGLDDLIGTEVGALSEDMFDAPGNEEDPPAWRESVPEVLDYSGSVEGSSIDKAFNPVGMPPITYGNGQEFVDSRKRPFQGVPFFVRVAPGRLNTRADLLNRLNMLLDQQMSQNMPIYPHDL